MEVNKNYIVSPYLFDQLSNVQGFNNTNGYTYQECIVRTFDDRISHDIKEKSMSMISIEDALNVLKESGVDYNHKWTD